MMYTKIYNLDKEKISKKKNRAVPLYDMGRPYIEVTTAGSCSVKCSKFCPHEVYKKAYGNPSDLMSMETFKQILSNLSTEYIVAFAGFCEPFHNPYCLDFAELAIDKGHDVAIFTTLIGINSNDLNRFLKIDWVEVCIHLPDPLQQVRVPVEERENYKEILFQIITNCKRVSFSIMNELFISNNRENICRGKARPRLFPRICDKWFIPQYVVTPNGDVYYCCMDFNLEYRLGNLTTTHISHLSYNAKRPYNLCKYCGQGHHFLPYLAIKLSRKLGFSLFFS